MDRETKELFANKIEFVNEVDRDCEQKNDQIMKEDVDVGENVKIAGSEDNGARDDTENQLPMNVPNAQDAGSSSSTLAKVEKIPKSLYPLVVGEMKFRLKLGDVFSMDFIIPPQKPRWYTDFYNSFENKYWNKVRKDPEPKSHDKFFYFCMICDKRFGRRLYLTDHINEHMGYYIARCQKCDSKFFSLIRARAHRIRCLKNH